VEKEYCGEGSPPAVAWRHDKVSLQMTFGDLRYGKVFSREVQENGGKNELKNRKDAN